MFASQSKWNRKIGKYVLAGAIAAFSLAVAQNIVPRSTDPPNNPPDASTRTTTDPNSEMNRVLWHPSTTPARNFDEVVDRAINTERTLVTRLRSKDPVIETYIQEVKKDPDLGFVPTHDFYFLGKLNLQNGVVDQTYLKKPSTLKAIPHIFTSLFTTEYYPGGFADEMFLDPTNFDRAHYTFEFVRKDFLGDVRCFVVDVTPKPDAGKRRFQGRMWVEDRDYHVIRFNGEYVPSVAHEFSHFDSWRVNADDLWLPAFIYAQDEGYHFGPMHAPPMRAQTRLWDYETSRERAQQAFTELTVDPSNNIRDNSQNNQNAYSPVQSERMWETEAEQNIVDRLQKAGLVAPESEVDQVMNTVLDNLEVTNNIALDPPVHVRILMTTPLELVAVNHTILISRGLIDVLPDEACLAAVIADGLAHVVLSHSVDTKYAFADRLLFDDPATLKKIVVARSQQEETAADQKAIEILKKSPYSDKLPKVGLFLRMLSARSDEVPHLIKPLIGNRMADTHRDLRLAGLMELGPQLEIRDKDQIAALPLGSRIRVNPWSNNLTLLKTQNVALMSAKEKMPFQLTPFMIYETRQSETAPAQQQSGPVNAPAANTSAPAANPPAAAANSAAPPKQ